MRNLPKDRLATTDVEGKRVYLYPSAVRGFFRDRKLWVHGFLVVLFLALPWLHVSGRQLLLLDVARREFFFFGLHFRAHDAPLVLFLFLGFAFLIGFVTAVWGRVWCGWACPQTVFTELLFRRIEVWIEGGPRERRELDQAPWTGLKIVKKGGKWLAFLAVSLVFTHSFLAYFTGSREVLAMMTRPPGENWASFLVVASTTALLLFDFGWFREQFCTIVCPYGRMQSVMLGTQSLVVGYDVARGEPRRDKAKPFLPQGDCIDCLRCVQVCPTGIDIRRGLQMECIACTACIDACDEVMTKIKKPTGLIRYMTLASSAGNAARGVNVRAVAFGVLSIITLFSLALVLTRKDFLDAEILRAKGSPYELVQGPQGELVVNHFVLELSNQTGAAQDVQAAFPEGTEGELVMPLNPLALADGARTRADFFVKFRRESAPGGSRAAKLLLRLKDGRTKQLEVPLVGPVP